jgi:hypothetical protein
MQADYSRVLPYFIAVMVVWAIYRRVRRSFGQQPLRPVRMRIRMGILLLLGVSFIPVALKSVQFLGAEVAGLVTGIALALWGASRTRYRSEGEQLYYLPHTYTGIVVSLLFIGRLAYRLSQAYLRNAVPLSGTDAETARTIAGPAMNMQSPLTAGLVFVVIGYYVVYYGVVLWKARRISPEDLEVVATPTSTAAGALPADQDVKAIIEARRETYRSERQS